MTERPTVYGVPAELDLTPFVGVDLNQICLGRFQVQFHFSGAGVISCESYWDLRGPTGELIDAECPHEARDCYRLHHILDQQVVRYAVDSPRSFTLVFGTGHALTVCDDSEHYESATLRMDSGVLIVI